MAGGSTIELTAATAPPSLSPEADETVSSRGQVDTFAAEAPADVRGFSAPPVDGGRDAWLFLGACFMLECLVWGFPFAFGVFQDYYSTHEPFAGSYKLALIGTCAMGIMYLGIPFVMCLQRLYPFHARWSPLAGLLILCVSLAASSFSQTVTHLIVTQGIFYAIGGGIAYGPCLLYIDQWFVARKGLAYGIMWSGTGLAGFVLPLLMQALLGRYGFRTTLRIWSLALFVLTVPPAFFIKPRIPVSRRRGARGARAPFRLGFVLSRTFLLHQTANIAEALGFFIPGVYLPSYARAALGASPFQAALTILLVNVSSVFGCVAMGHLIDRVHVTTCLLLSAAGTAAGTLLLWGLSTNLAVLYVFCVVYGLFAGSYTSTWPGIMHQVATASTGGTSSSSYSSSSSPAGASATPASSGGAAFDPPLVLAFLAAGRGIGNVISGPLSEALIKGMPWQGRAAAAYGSGYGTLIAFTGVSALVGGASFLWRRIGWL